MWEKHALLKYQNRSRLTLVQRNRSPAPRQVQKGQSPSAGNAYKTNGISMTLIVFRGPLVEFVPTKFEAKWLRTRVCAWLMYCADHGLEIHVDPSGCKHGPKLVRFAGHPSANSMVSRSQRIQVDPLTDPSSYALLAITRQTRWYQDPSGSKLGSKQLSGKPKSKTNKK